MESKPCARCGAPERRPHMAYCGPCANAYQSEYRRRRYRDDAEYRARIKGANRERLYQVTDAEYNELLGAQNGLCAICHRPPQGVRSMNVDHCHDTGRIRGLLCGPCNRGLGLLGDDPERLRSALAYLAIFDN